MDVIKTLNEFVEVALRNRKYATNSAYGYKAAFRVFDEELSSEERESFELFKNRFDQIFSNILVILLLVRIKSRSPSLSKSPHFTS